MHKRILLVTKIGVSKPMCRQRVLDKERSYQVTRGEIWLLSANTFRRDISSYRRDQLWVLSGRSEIFQICHSFLGSDKLKMLVLHACGRWPCLGL